MFVHVAERVGMCREKLNVIYSYYMETKYVRVECLTDVRCIQLPIEKIKQQKNGPLIRKKEKRTKNMFSRTDLEL